MHIDFGKTIEKLPDTVVSAIFRQEGEFTMDDVMTLIDKLCEGRKTDKDVPRNKILELVDYTMRSFLQSNRIICVDDGKYKVRP